MAIAPRSFPLLPRAGRQTRGTRTSRGESRRPAALWSLHSIFSEIVASRRAPQLNLAFWILRQLILLSSVFSVSSVVKSEKLNTEFAENRRGPQRSLPQF